MSDVLRENLRRVLDQKKRSGRDVSIKAGLSESAVKHILRGTSHSPRYDSVVAIAAELGVPVAELTGSDAPGVQSDDLSSPAPAKLQKSDRDEKTIKEQLLAVQAGWPLLSFEERDSVTTLVESIVRRKSA